MDFKQLRYFCVIAQEKSITKAAEKCYIAQPSLSQSIANLEKELGVKLLDRASRGISLTQAGEVFYRYATGVLQEEKQIRQKLLDSEKEPAGEITLCMDCYASTVLRLVSQFKKEYPHVTFRIMEKRATGEKPDLVIANCREKENDYTSEKLYEERLLALHAKNHPLARRKSVRLDELSDDVFILRSGDELNEPVMTYCRAAGFRPEKIQISPNADTVAQMILLFGGVAFVTEGNCETLPDSIGVWHLTQPDCRRAVYLSSLHNEYENAAVKAFRSRLENYFAGKMGKLEIFTPGSKKIYYGQVSG